MINLKIDTEFQNQIPPLTDDEYKQLEENILKEGKLLSPLIVWGNIGMRKVYNRYRLPMIVTENGMAYSETLGPDGQIHDPYRIEYLKEHIEQLAIMIDEGLPVFGYCPWSFVDVVSSHQGFAKRYGLVYVDRTETDPKQCARVKKDSFYWYQKVITNNGLTE